MIKSFVKGILIYTGVTWTVNAFSEQLLNNYKCMKEGKENTKKYRWVWLDTFDNLKECCKIVKES